MTGQWAVTVGMWHYCDAALLRNPSTRHLDNRNITGWVKNKEQKQVVRIIDVVSYALKMGVTCVCSLFQQVINHKTHFDRLS